MVVSCWELAKFGLDWTDLPGLSRASTLGGISQGIPKNTYNQDLVSFGLAGSGVVWKERGLDWTDLRGVSGALFFRRYGVGNSQEHLLTRFGLEFTRLG